MDGWMDGLCPVIRSFILDNEFFHDYIPQNVKRKNFLLNLTNNLRTDVSYEWMDKFPSRLLSYM